MSEKPHSQFSLSSTGGRVLQIIPTLLVLVGTAFLRLAEFLALLPPNTIVLCVDVPGELAKLRLRLVRDRVIQTIELGDNKTTQQLMEAHGSDAQIFCLSKIACTSSEGGAAQLSAIGGAAARALFETGGFRQFFEHSVLPMLSAMAGGCLKQVNLDIRAGASGGGGSEASCVLYDELTRLILDLTNANVACDVHIQGKVTYESPGFPRTQLNAAGAIARWAQRAISPPDARVTTALRCYEINPVGTNKGLRDALVIEQLQALQSPQVAQHLKRVSSNHSADAPLGNVAFIRADHFHALALENVAADVAQAYLPALVGLASCRPDTLLVKRFHWGIRSTPEPQESVESILNRTLYTPSEELVASLTASPAIFKTLPLLDLHDGRQLGLQDVKAVFGSSADTVAELSERIQLLRTCQVVVDRNRDEIEDELTELYGLQTRLTRRVDKSISAIQNATFLSKVRSGTSKIERAAKAFGQLRDNSDQVLLLERKLASIVAAQNGLAEELTSLLTKLARLQHLLEQSLPKGDRRHLQACVKPLPMDAILPELLSLAETANTSINAEVVHLLAQAVEFVTQTGLAQIVGAPDDSIDAIVRAVRTGPFFLEGPAWGGLPVRQGPIDRFIVYPPVDPLLAENITQCHHRSDDGHRMAFSRTSLCSINVVQLDITFGKTLEDLLNQSYMRSLRRAVASPLGTYFLDNSDEFLAELGIDLTEPEDNVPQQS